MTALELKSEAYLTLYLARTVSENDLPIDIKDAALEATETKRKQVYDETVQSD